MTCWSTWIIFNDPDDASEIVKLLIPAAKHCGIKRLILPDYLREKLDRIPGGELTAGKRIHPAFKDSVPVVNIAALLGTPGPQISRWYPFSDDCDATEETA